MAGALTILIIIAVFFSPADCRPPVFSPLLHCGGPVGSRPGPGSGKPIRGIGGAEPRQPANWLRWWGDHHDRLDDRGGRSARRAQPDAAR